MEIEVAKDDEDSDDQMDQLIPPETEENFKKNLELLKLVTEQYQLECSVFPREFKVILLPLT